jgi:hypothetical protein
MPKMIASPVFDIVAKKPPRSRFALGFSGAGIDCGTRTDGARQRIYYADTTTIEDSRI